MNKIKLKNMHQWRQSFWDSWSIIGRLWVGLWVIHVLMSGKCLSVLLIKVKCLRLMCRDRWHREGARWRQQNSGKQCSWRYQEDASTPVVTQQFSTS